MLRRGLFVVPLKSVVSMAVAFLALVFIAGGCSQGKDEKKGGGDHGGHTHAHASIGPHGGAIIEWGDHVHHLEITFDRDKQQATVYVLDHDVKKPQPTAIESPALRLDGLNELIPLVATPLEGESSEKASRYVGTHTALAAKAPFAGALSGKIGTDAYFASFKEAAAKASTTHDDDHGHTHEKDAHDHEKDAHDHDHAHEKDDKAHDHSDGDHAHDHDHDHDHDHAAEKKVPADAKPPADDKPDAHSDADHDHKDE